MPLKESEAIILRTFPLGEGDRLVSFLDRRSGRLRGVARGARHPKSRFGSTLELLSYIRIWYFERETRELVRINQCELVESFLDVQRDYLPSTALALMSEITEAALAEREVADAQFRLILLSARAIRSHGASPAIVAYFCMWTARLGGWLGSLDQCSKCGRSVREEAGFHYPGHAEVFCANCRLAGMKGISKEALSIGRSVLSGSLERLLKTLPQVEASKEILAFALDLLEYHLEKRLNSRNTFEVGEAGNIEI
jgi:DNA repair protein RecO (recombination protein O)